MKQYKVFIWDSENAGTRVYFLLAKDKDDIIFKFSNIFRNNPSYKLSSITELNIDELARFEYFIQY